MIDLDLFISKLEAQKESYKTMLKISLRQKEFINARDIESLYTLTEEKRKLMDDIDAIESAVGPIKANWSKIKQDLTSDQVLRVEAVVDEAIQVLREIIAIEEECKKFMEERRRSAYATISSISGARKSLGSYKSQGQQGGVIDTGG